MFILSSRVVELNLHVVELTTNSLDLTYSIPRTDKGEGRGQKSQNGGDVIYGRSLT